MRYFLNFVQREYREYLLDILDGYEIEGKNLVVYMLFRPTRLPIDKIKSVKKTTGILSTAAMSTKRVSISFTDRSVLKSFAPVEISPKDRDGFMAQLKLVNPNIEVLS